MADDTCRTCLETNGLLPIFGEDNILANMIMCCSSVKVQENDGLPMVICETCFGHLQTAYNFRRLCELSDIKLRNIEININFVSNNLELKFVDTRADQLKYTIATECQTETPLQIQEAGLNVDKHEIDNDEIYEEIIVTGKEYDITIEDVTEYNKNKPVILEEGTEINTDDKKLQFKSKFRNQCPHCGKLFLGKGYLKSHILIHLGEKPHQCDVCHCKFTQKCHLIRHLRTHSGEKPYQCKECGKKFANLQTHQAVHSNSRTHICRICSRGFKSHNELKSHEGIHTGVKSHQCHLCDKIFYKKSYLNVHIQGSHLGERKHKCKICEKTFTKSSNLKCHLRIHTGEQPYDCKVCSNKFNQPSSLKRHMKIHKQGQGEAVDKDVILDSNQDNMDEPNGINKTINSNGIVFKKNLKRSRRSYNVQ